MLTAGRRKAVVRKQAVIARSSYWVRAAESGILRALVPLGKRVEKGDLLGLITDPCGTAEIKVRARHQRIVIGRSQLPRVHQGEAPFHLTQFDHTERAPHSLEVCKEPTDPAAVGS